MKSEQSRHVNTELVCRKRVVPSWKSMRSLNFQHKPTRATQNKHVEASILDAYAHHLENTGTLDRKYERGMLLRFIEERPTIMK